jgi:hypothetical protein
MRLHKLHLRLRPLPPPAGDESLIVVGSWLVCEETYLHVQEN